MAASARPTLPWAIDEINRRVTLALAARDMDPASIINDELGPLWYRGLTRKAEGMPAATPPSPALPATPVKSPANVDEELAHVLTASGARRIVIGHTPLVSGVAVTNGGRLVRIDSGISRAYGGVPGYVEIIGDRVIAHNVPRPGSSQ